ncbi:DUF4258 domain-containing protein [Candidatus Gracilibacteria bacterium]|nr:DUF4258 domain-containing protein [Candidatus Gracilibacteria bacterium]
MGIFYTNHILERLSQRGIPKEAIEYVLENGNIKIEGTIKIFEGIFKIKKLKIITKIKGNNLILITAYYLC